MERVKIHASIIDDITKKQVDTLAESEAYKNAIIRVMPDCHAGKGCTIGTVIKYSDRVVPNTVGVDIGCGMSVLFLGKIDIDLKKLDEVINKYIPAGFNIHEKHRITWFNSLIAKVTDWDYIQRSIGTLGGGNHFIEIDVDEEDNKYLVIHSGSRNLGVQVCNYWQQKAIDNLTDDSEERQALIDKLKEEGRQQEISEELAKLKKPQTHKDLAYLEGNDLENYIHDMEVCQKYAEANRKEMICIICEKMWGGFPAENYTYFSTIHNYIDIPKKIVRKGAISADEGEVVLIPMNMKDGSLICVGRGNADWLNSAPHGAGRIMSRSQAFKEVKMKDFRASMKGIYSTSICKETKDEAPMVYKNALQIMTDIMPTVEIVKVIKPIYNFKAKTAESGKLYEMNNGKDSNS